MNLTMTIISYAFITGIGGASVWIPGACTWILPFFLVPAWFDMNNVRTTKQIFLGTLFAQTVGGMIGFYWVYRVLTTMFAFPPWGGALGSFLFSSVGQLHFALGATAWAWLRQRYPLKPWASYFVLAGLVFIFEQISPLLFPFNFGYPWLWSGTSIAQLASVIGFSGLSLFTYCLNAIFTIACLEIKQRRFKKALVFASSGFAVLITAMIWGHHLKEQWSEPNKTVRIGYAQASLESHFRLMNVMGPDYRNYELNRYVDLTNQALQKNVVPDFIVWPENVLLLEANTDDALGMVLRRQVAKWNIPLISGLQAAVDPQKQLDLQYGSAVFYGRNGDIDHIYNKVKLVPLGEFIPWGKFLPMMKLFDLGSAPMKSGGRIESGIRKVGDVTVGTDICYESIDPLFSKVFAKNGVELIINISSDIWFGQTLEPYQHFYLSMARAIESRRPVVRIASTGISGYALANGDIKTLAGSYETASGIFEVPYQTGPDVSFFNRHGHWLLIIWALLALSPLLYGRIRKT